VGNKRNFGGLSRAIDAMLSQIVKKATGVGMCVLIVLYVAIWSPRRPRGTLTPLRSATQELHSSTATGNVVNVSVTRQTACTRIVILGDSLVAGGYWSERDGALKLSYAPWDVAFRDAFLRRAQQRVLRCAGPNLTVTAFGYPGRRIRGVLDMIVASGSKAAKYAAMRTAVSAADVVVILLGTNDVLAGNTVAMRDEMNRLVTLHERVRALSDDRAVTIAVTPLPLHVSLPSSAFGQQLLARPICHSQMNDAVQNERQKLLELLNRSVLARCRSDAIATGLQATGGARGLSAELEQFWSDCVHPNPAGFAVMGARLGESVADMIASGDFCRSG
jgi:lysophospholipase L1-like esterase